MNPGNPAPHADRVSVEDLTIPASDGLPLAATVFMPSQARAWCSIASANGVRRRYYRRFATFLAQQGVAAVTFDYRGIGDSPPTWPGDAGRPPTGPPTMRAFGELDLDGVLQWIHTQHDGTVPQLHVGHSGGGQFLGLAPHNHHVSAAVAIASQSGYWRLWPTHKPKMWLLWHVLLPGSTRLRGHFPAKWFGMGEPLPKTVALEWARWCRHPDFIVDGDGKPLRQHFQSWPGRLRAYAITDDQQFAPRPAAEALMGFYRNAQTEVVDLAPKDLGVDAIGHFGYFTKTCQGHWPTLLAWLLDEAPAQAPR